MNKLYNSTVCLCINMIWLVIAIIKLTDIYDALEHITYFVWMLQKPLLRRCRIGDSLLGRECLNIKMVCIINTRHDNAHGNHDCVQKLTSIKEPTQTVYPNNKYYLTILHTNKLSQPKMVYCRSTGYCVTADPNRRMFYCKYAETSYRDTCTE